MTQQFQQVDEHDTGVQSKDVLLQSLLLLAKLENKKFTANELVAGLPLKNNTLTPKIFIRAAARAGYKADIRKRKLKKIHNADLPLICLLKNGKACIVLKQNKKAKQFLILDPDVGLEEKVV
ncbi:MAG: cysteine peptidase family C39 domain-containing protein, partial [Thioalkalispiraceae bacterium]